MRQLKTLTLLIALVGLLGLSGCSPDTTKLLNAIERAEQEIQRVANLLEKTDQLRANLANAETNLEIMRGWLQGTPSREQIRPVYNELVDDYLAVKAIYLEVADLLPDNTRSKAANLDTQLQAHHQRVNAYLEGGEDDTIELFGELVERAQAVVTLVKVVRNLGD